MYIMLYFAFQLNLRETTDINNTQLQQSHLYRYRCSTHTGAVQSHVQVHMQYSYRCGAVTPVQVQVRVYCR